MPGGPADVVHVIKVVALAHHVVLDCSLAADTEQLVGEDPAAAAPGPERRVPAPVEIGGAEVVRTPVADLVVNGWNERTARAAAIVSRPSLMTWSG